MTEIMRLRRNLRKVMVSRKLQEYLCCINQPARWKCREATAVVIPPLPRRELPHLTGPVPRTEIHRFSLAQIQRLLIKGTFIPSEYIYSMFPESMSSSAKVVYTYLQSGVREFK